MLTKIRPGTEEVLILVAAGPGRSQTHKEIFVVTP